MAARGSATMASDAVFLDDPLIAGKADASVVAAMVALREDFAAAGIAVRDMPARVPLG